MKWILIFACFLAVLALHGQAVVNAVADGGRNDDGFKTPYRFKAADGKYYPLDFGNQKPVRSNDNSKLYIDGPVTVSEIKQNSGGISAEAAISGYHIGDHWIYETEIYEGGPSTMINYRPYYIDGNNGTGVNNEWLIDSTVSFYVDDRKMYFWDEYYQEYVMYYDWASTGSYDIKYYDKFKHSEEIATVVVDSVSYLLFGNDSIQVQHVQILNSGTLEEYYDVVYEGVGAGNMGVKFVLGCGLCDEQPIVTKLRCFVNGTKTYQFQPYPCDSSWNTTATIELSDRQVKIYPNPASGMVHIDGIDRDVPYELLSVNGMLLRRGNMLNQSIPLDLSGMYVLRLWINDSWHNVKLVNIE